jgi:cobyrinic acid a,c-diamide synthase
MKDTIPRLVMASTSETADVASVTLALAVALRRDGYQPQHFHGVAVVQPVDHMAQLVGLASRHLDLWVMSPERCRSVFARTASLVDIALIEEPPKWAPDSSAAHLAMALQAPLVGVVSAEDLRRTRLLDHQPLWPLTAVLIDGVRSERELDQWRSFVSQRLQAPVLGALEELPSARESLRRGRFHSGRSFVQLVELMAGSLLRLSRLDSLVEIARSSAFPYPTDVLSPAPGSNSSRRVAVAWDEAYRCYFPDSLDEFQQWGAELVDFSPATNETLPEGTDFVLLGCGRLRSDYLRRLSANYCMHSALRAEACRGTKIYAEGAGIVPLCQTVRSLDGSCWTMSGVLPASLVQTETEGPPFEPVEMTIRKPTAIFRPGDVVRGYRCRRWRWELGPGCEVVATGPDQEPLMVQRKQCLASLVYVNFAAWPQHVDSALQRTTSALSREAWN